jgi:hypothetical protein
LNVGNLCLELFIDRARFVDDSHTLKGSVDNNVVIKTRNTNYQHFINTIIYIERISILFLISSIFFLSSVTESTLLVIVLTA